MKDGRKNERNEATVSSMKGIGFLILCLGLVVTFLGMEASPCIIWCAESLCSMPVEV
jgi:hypothetical protein